MATLTDIAHGLGDRLRTIYGLSVYDEPVDSFDFGPGGAAAIISIQQGTGIKQVEYDTVGGGVDDSHWVIRVLAPDEDDVNSSDLLYSFMSRGTDNSVYDAVNGDVTLGGVAEKTLVIEAVGFGVLPYLDNRSFAYVDVLLLVVA